MHECSMAQVNQTISVADERPENKHPESLGEIRMWLIFFLTEKRAKLSISTANSYQFDLPNQDTIAFFYILDIVRVVEDNLLWIVWPLYNYNDDKKSRNSKSWFLVPSFASDFVVGLTLWAE